MRRFTRIAAGTAFAGTLFLSAGLAPATAANQAQDGLVNVAVGDITVQDINVGVAAGIIANVCNVKVGPIAVLATQVDVTGLASSPYCPATGGNASITQN